MNVFVKKKDSRSFWNIITDIGEFNAEPLIKENAFCADDGILRVVSDITEDKNGVFKRNGNIKNISDKSLSINALSSRFTFDGGEYEVYTQYNSWQNESMGGWQELVTSVSARCKSVRNSFNAAPFVVLWSKQANRGVAFHINAFSSWEMRISRRYAEGISTYVEVEMGINSEGLSLELTPGDEIALPEIIYYEVFNKTDLDCWKLHSFLHTNYPRREMPVIYNSWLYKFDRFSYKNIMIQIKKAAEIGVEYFVVDAGWFGEGENWGDMRGDWEENKSFGFRGRMKEVADAVRDFGMKFGFWLEPECASLEANAPKEHPEYYLMGNGSYFIDFANPDAFKYIFDKTCELIERFDAKFVKFDFNADLEFDVYYSGFTSYFEGYVRFIKDLHRRFPDLYTENCASGGMRMTLRDGMLYDSFWLSDNQCPYYGVEIFKNSLLRLAPQWIESWLSIASARKIAPVYASYEQSDKIIACGDAVWDNVRGVSQSWINGFLTSSPVGLSFDLTAISDEVFNNLKKYIEKFKSKREFWKKAVCHILTDTDTMLVLEFRDEEFSEIELVVFSKKTLQNNICVYPIVDGASTYACSNGNVRAGWDIVKNGIDFEIGKSFDTCFMTLTKNI